MRRLALHRIYGRALERQSPPSSSVIDAWEKRVCWPCMDRQLRTGDQHADHGEGLDFYNVGGGRETDGLGIWYDDKLWVSRNYVYPRILAAGPDITDFIVDYETWPVDTLRTVREMSRFKLMSIASNPVSNLSQQASAMIGTRAWREPRWRHWRTIWSSVSRSVSRRAICRLDRDSRRRKPSLRILASVALLCVRPIRGLQRVVCSNPDRGSGAYVPDEAQYRAFQVMAEEIGEVDDVLKFLEMRMGFEAEVADLAARRRTEQDFVELRRALAAMEASCDGDVSVAADAAFHAAIASATGNPCFLRFTQFLWVLFVPSRRLYPQGDDPVRYQRYAHTINRDHEAIVTAIEASDPVSARRAARHHIEKSILRYRTLKDGQ